MTRNRESISPQSTRREQRKKERNNAGEPVEEI